MDLRDLKAPPPMRKDLPYKEWLHELKIWKSFITLDKKKLGPAVFLSLAGEARDAAREISEEDLCKENGLDVLITKLDSLFLKDENNSAFEAYEAFENYQRPQDMDMTTYINTFERLYQKAKNYKLELPDGVRAYRLLKSANVTAEKEQLARATLPSLTYDNMKAQLKKIFNDCSTSFAAVKVEPTYKASHEVAEAEAYYARGGGHNSFRGGGFRRGRGRFYNRGYTNFHRGSTHPKSTQPGAQTQGPSDSQKSRRKLNPLDYNGQVSLCSVCGSRFHWARDCPDAHDAPTLVVKSENDCEVETEPIMITWLADLWQPTANKDVENVFLSETLNFAVVDSGCSRTVCGETWMQCCLDSLSESDSKIVENSTSHTWFKFGDGSKVQSLKKIKFPAYVGQRKVFIVTDVIPNEIPLLLSKESMKKAGGKLDFKQDTITLFDMVIPLQTTNTGHYLLSINDTRRFGKEVLQPNIILFSNQFVAADEKERHRIAVKIHKQFGHPRYNKLRKLVSDAGVSDPKFFETLEDVEKSCDICKRFKKGPLRPVVGFDMAKVFNEVVALDLKQWSFSPKIWFLHMIDLATRYSVCVVIRNKHRDTIISAIMVRWISIFGSPRQVLSDNGAEFNNEDFRSMAENFNIRVCTTAAESPWSNGCNERYNGVISEMVQKVIQDTKCSLEIALAWAVSAKNSLENHYGFSPNQLVFGRNPNYPSLLYDDLPALEKSSPSKLVCDNLNALYSNQSEFFQKVACEKLRRAMLYKVRPTGEHFVNGDQVFYRRSNDRKWQGPATVIGQENKQILVKHGGVYYRCHSCNLMRNDGKAFNNDNLGLPKDDCCGTKLDLDQTNNNGISNQVRQIYFDDEEDCDLEKTNDEVEKDSDINSACANIGSIDDPDQIEAGLSEGKTSSPDFLVTRQQASVLPKAKTRIAYLEDENSEWKHATVLGRAGKVTGKNKFFMNIQDDGEVSGRCVDWRNIDDWKEVCEEVNFCSDKDLLEAKHKELLNWEANKVYVAELDNGQKAINCRWVFSNKMKSDGSSFVKARLVARGFEEDSSSIQTDSPTCGKEAFRVVLAIAASKGWRCHSLDVKSAFLQGKALEREVYLRPPPEAKAEGYVWHLRKCVYGLNDASRYWYMRVRQELFKLGMRTSKFDKAIFYWYEKDELAGVITCHVDDFFWCGAKDFEVNVIAKLRDIFLFGEEHSDIFRYIGMDIHQQENGKIFLHQNAEVDNLQAPLIRQDRLNNVDSSLDKDELRVFRGICGQLNWVANQSRPDLAFDSCDLSCSIKNAKIGDLLRAAKVVRKAKSQRVSLKFTKLDLATMKIVIYSDASYCNLPDGSSQGGHIIFLCDAYGVMVPITWSSTKIRRIARSVLAAECLALQDAADSAVLIAGLLSEMLYNSKKSINIVAKTDNRGVHGALISTKAVKDMRLRVDMAYLKQMLEKQELEKVLWIHSAEQLADCLTKKTASSKALLNCLHYSCIA